MFEVIVSKIANIVRVAAGATEAAVRRAPLVSTATLIALLFVLF